jgi:hypothetical protein
LGLSAEKVREITGHKTNQMLARYTHLKAENIATEIDQLKLKKNGDHGGIMETLRRNLERNLFNRVDRSELLK